MVSVSFKKKNEKEEEEGANLKDVQKLMGNSKVIVNCILRSLQINLIINVIVVISKIYK